MALPGGINILAVAAVVVIGVGALLHIIGLATPEWSGVHVNDQSTTYGLWKYCLNDFKTDACLEYTNENIDDDWLNSLKACGAFAILGMLASILGLAMAAIAVLFPIMGKPKNAMFPVISLAGCVAAFVCILIAIIVWGAKVHGDFVSKLDIGYSFILSIIGGVLICAGGVLAYHGNK